IHRHALAQESAAVFLHHDGQLFVPRDHASTPGMKEMISVNYPGRPPLPYRAIKLGAADMDHCATLIWESLYRVVPLTPGQTYKSGYLAVNGKRIEYENIARDGEVLAIGNSDVEKTEDLRTLTDQDILAF